MTDEPLDLAAVPMEYPGPMIGRSMLMLPSGGHVEVHRTVDLPPLTDRTPVLAIGSNACAGVLRWKLERDGVSTLVPLVRATISQLVVAPSAHVSRAGFVPAAPHHVAGAASEVVLSWLDREQLDCIDRTEPNYRRTHLARCDYALEPGVAVPVDGFGVDGFDVDGFEVYESIWGVVPRRLPTQAELALWLGDLGLEPWASHEPAAAVAALAASLELRERARDSLQSRASGSGLISRRDRD